MMNSNILSDVAENFYQQLHYQRLHRQFDKIDYKAFVYILNSLLKETLYVFMKGRSNHLIGKIKPWSRTLITVTAYH